MPAIVTGRTVEQLKAYSNEIFFRDMAIFASIVLTAGTATAEGAGAVAARGYIGKYAAIASSRVGIQFKAAAAGFIGSMIKEIWAWARDGNTSASDGIKALIFEVTGLKLETLDKEGTKKAIGQLMADTLNTRYGTGFTAFYPIENIIEQIKLELQSEIIEAVASGI
jgi:hypothetical protein